jgi:hypothetical protein
VEHTWQIEAAGIKNNVIKKRKKFNCPISFFINYNFGYRNTSFPKFNPLTLKHSAFCERLTGNISSAVEYHLLNLLPQPSMHIISAGDKVSEFSMESTE